LFFGGIRVPELITVLNEDSLRQYSDARSAFLAWEATEDACARLGRMFWRNKGGVDYLVKTSPANVQKGLGRRSVETETVYARFIDRKAGQEARLASLKESLARHQRMNRALHVGRAPKLLADILAALAKHRLLSHFTVVGTHALYAYEAAAGIRFEAPGALATKDIDLLWDTRRNRVRFETDLLRAGPSMLGLLQRVDPTFQLREDQKHTAVNSKGFEVDIIRREAHEGDPHPMRISSAEEDFWVVQARRAGVLLSAPRFEAVIVSTTGHMARMPTVDPAVFAKFKRWMSEQVDRDPLKRNRDRLQAETVEHVLAEYLPQVG
jgi:hypothetical protein